MKNKKWIVTAVAAAIVLSVQAGSVFAAEVSDSDLAPVTQASDVTEPDHDQDIVETQDEDDNTDTSEPEEAQEADDSEQEQQAENLAPFATVEDDSDAASDEENANDIVNVGSADDDDAAAFDNTADTDIPLSEDGTSEEDEPTIQDIQALIDEHIAQLADSPDADEETVTENRALWEGLLKEITQSEAFTADDVTMADVKEYFEIMLSSLTPEDDQIITSGQCGENLTWRYDASDETLTISGSGDMYDFDDVEYTDLWWNGVSQDVKKVVFDGNITSIGSGAFTGMNITRIEIPASVTRIDNTAFDLNEVFAHIDVAKDNRHYTSADGILYNKDMTELLLFPTAKTAAAFTTPDSVEKIGNSAFSGNDTLRSVVISDSVKVIDDGAFSDCRHLNRVTVGKSVSTIGAGAFANCVRLDEVTLGPSVQNIGYMAFFSSGITQITLPHWIKSIESGAFTDCALTDVYYLGTKEEWAALELDEPSTSEDNGRPIFHFTPADHYDEPAGLVRAERDEFRLDEETVAEMEASIDEFIDMLKESEDVEPEQVEEVEQFLTNWLDKLKALGSDDPDVSEEAMKDLSSYMEDLFTKMMQQLMGEFETSGKCGEHLTWSFNQETGLLTISGEGDMYDYLPEEEEDEATEEDALIEEDTDFNMEDDTEPTTDELIRSMAANFFALYGDNDITGDETGDETDDENVPWLELAAFIKGVKFAGNVTSIGRGAFLLCSFPTIDIPASITRIGENTIDAINGLVSVNVASDNAHYSSLDGILFDKNRQTLLRYPAQKPDTAYTIPETVKEIADYAFQGCDYLTGIVIPDTVKRVGEGAFSGCRQLREAVIGQAVTRIEDGTFLNCFKLGKVTIPRSVTFIAENAFEDCDITDVFYLGTKEAWQNIDLEEDIDVWDEDPAFRHVNFANAVIHYQTAEPDAPVPVPSDGSDVAVNTAKDTQTDTANPKTGEESAALPLFLMAESAFVAAIALAAAKSRKREENA